MMIKLFLILAACVAINHGLKCIACTTQAQGDDCQKNPSQFSTDCSGNEICKIFWKEEQLTRSCGPSDNGDKEPTPTCVLPGPGSCECNGDLCNNSPDVGVGGGGGGGGGDTTPKNDTKPGGGGADDPGSRAADLKKFNISCWLITIITFTIFTHFFN